MKPRPSASDITVLETLERLDTDFAAVVDGIERGEFALWVGSGISRCAPSLGGLISRAIEFIRLKAVDPATQAKFEPVFVAALTLAVDDPETLRANFASAFETWTQREKIVKALWKQYSKFLDIPVDGEQPDYLLWEAVDIRRAFESPAPPAAEHLCIAILILEGAVREVASGNWDGFIEAAVERLSPGVPGLLQVVVDPNHLRDAAGKARLLKFHGCIIHATQAPNDYRKYLTATEIQIIDWPNKQELAPMKAAITAVATNYKTLMFGLSVQDANLHGVFSAARQTNPWPWPCAPNAQGHVFCEDTLQPGQKTMLRAVYGAGYNVNINAIETSAHLRAWGEQALLALVLKILTHKLCVLATARLEATGLAADAGAVNSGISSLRDAVASQAVGDRTAFVNEAIGAWSRTLRLFRKGDLPLQPDAYEVLSASSPAQLAADQNAQASGLGELAIALAMLDHGAGEKLWTLKSTSSSALADGAFTAVASWNGATERPVFIVRSAGIAIELEKQGAFANDNAIVIHGDDLWHMMRDASGGSARGPKRAPGRTGMPGTRHVSIARMIESEPDIASLQKRFIGEVTL
ncbi:SIR2 family protein [Tardiphaga sp.]|uniref:SIR2 family protein n=1 Tax=Tardiphaga sp. TaxID=1926292 RepID=UPI0026167086|nr:SIR2 family protein [Tardiphaga sp.]MDB5620426.1 hypothetical protein [Tardiphaga sp.]